MDINNSAYVPYEGLKLPNERQRELTNQQVHWQGWGEPITAPGTYNGPDAAERGMKDEDDYYNDKFFYIQALYRKSLDRMLVEEFGLYGCPTASRRKILKQLLMKLRSFITGRIFQ